MRQYIYDGGGGPLSTIDGILQEDYVVKKIVSQVNMATYFLSRLTSRKTTAGRHFVVPVQLGVGEGQGNRGENEDLPDEGAGEFEQAIGVVRYQYGALYITGQSIEATESGQASFVPALKQALKDCRDGFKLNRQRQVHSDGSGVIGTVNGAHSAQTVINVTNPYGLSYIQSDLDNSQRVRLFRRRMKVYFGTADVARSITAVDPAAGTITVDSAVTLVDGETIIRGDATGKTSANKEFRGLSEVIKTTGTYMNIPRAGTPEWQGQRLRLGTGSGGPITETAFQRALDLGEINGTAECTLVMTDHKTRERFVALLAAQKRYLSPMDLEGGFKALEYNGKPIVVDKDHPPQRVRFIRLEDIYWLTMKPTGWINRDGTVLKWVDKKDAYRAYLAAYEDLFCERPPNQIEMYDVIGN